MSQRLLRAEKCATQVDREHLVEVLDRQLVGVLGNLDAGVVDEDVDAAVLVEHSLEHRRDLTLLRDVSRDEDRLRARGDLCFDEHLHAVLDGFPVSSAPSGRRRS